MTIGSEPGTGTSRAHSSGTRSNPRFRAATAGNRRALHEALTAVAVAAVRWREML